MKAARERAVIPMEIRMKQFKDMLQEKEVSAFSTWEKELHKIVFDPRYLLLTSKERKQVFESYVKERAEEERKEKRNKLKERKDQFRALMEDVKLHGKWVVVGVFFFVDLFTVIHACSQVVVQRVLTEVRT